MYQFSYENQGINTYLVYTMADDEIVDSMSLGMITNNKIAGLAPAMFLQMNNTRYVKYIVSSKIPAKQLFMGAVNRKRLLGVFKGIIDAVMSAEDYMLDTNRIILDPDYIFTDVTTCDTVLIYLPVAGQTENVTDLKLFFRNIIFTTQFDQTENCDYVAKIINYLNSAPVFIPAVFGELLESIKSEQNVGWEIPTEHPANNAPQQKPAQNSAVNQEIRPLQKEIQAKWQTPPGQGMREVMQALPGQGVQEAMQAPPGQGVQAPPRKRENGNIPFAMPGHGQPLTPQGKPVPASPAGSADHQEKSISLFYLLQHYNKENAAIYKNQKAGKKTDKKGGKKADARSVSSFAMPGTDPQPNASFGQVPNQAFRQPQGAEPWPSAPEPSSEPNAMPQNVSKNWSSPYQSRNNAIQGSRSPGMDFGATVIVGDDDDYGTTVVVGQDNPGQKITPHLIRLKNNEKIPVNKDVFRLGRDRDFNDYVITDNQSVGRSHCHILVKEGEYYIVDNNSKNHTYVDGTAIPSGYEVKITHAQKICLSNEEFEFRLF